MVVLCAGYIHDISLVNVGPSHQHQHKSDEHSLPNTENQSTKYFIRNAKERDREHRVDVAVDYDDCANNRPTNGFT